MDSYSNISVLLKILGTVAVTYKWKTFGSVSKKIKYLFSSFKRPKPFRIDAC